MSITIYHNPKCSKSRQTLKLLEEQGINPKIIEYLKNPPTSEKLKEILSLLKIPPRDLMRKKEDEYKLDVFVDKCSVEIFLDGGKIAMTNLIFPTEPYNRMCFYSKGGTFAVDSFSVHRLGL